MSGSHFIFAADMSLRDWFAGQIAAAWVIADGTNNDRARAMRNLADAAGVKAEVLTAHLAYKLADALVAQSKETPVGETENAEVHP